MNSDRQWAGKWITAKMTEAPLFEKTFTVSKVPSKAEIYICGLGFYRLFLNGEEIGKEDLLKPTFTAYDKSVCYNQYPLHLNPGENKIAVEIGRGWFEEKEDTSWEFSHATWHTSAQLLCEIIGDGVCLVATDTTWTVRPSKTVFHSLRCGETYDGTAPDAPAQPVKIGHGGGGYLKKQTIQQVRVCEVITPTLTRLPEGSGKVLSFDCGKNISGNVEITVKGRCGQKIVINYTELPPDVNGVINQHEIAPYVHGEKARFQQDIYICPDDEEHTWHANYGYNGFRYAVIKTDDPSAVLSVRARSFHTPFDQIGFLETDNLLLKNLYEAVLQSTLTNFMHMPTDCPHREKNGWTGDACLSAYQSCFHFDMRSAYFKWLDDIVDSQRPNGAISCIVPTSVWGYNWGTGITWDMVLFELPWQAYLAYGNKLFLSRYQPTMKRYLGFLDDMLEHDIARDGLGDWCPPDRHCYNQSGIVSDTALLTGCAYYVFRLYEKMQRILENTDEAIYAHNRADAIADAFRKEFIGKEPLTQGFCSMVLYFGLCREEEQAYYTEALLKAIEQYDGHLHVGIFGVKFLFHALCQQGKVETAWRLLNQTDYPSFGFMLKNGSGTLWEMWDGTASRNHHMYSSVMDFIYRDVMGIRMMDGGYTKVQFAPHIPTNLRNLHIRRTTAQGNVEMILTPEELIYRVPKECKATVIWKGETLNVDREIRLER